jgi:hypothetical protein
MEFYSATKKNKILSFTSKWMEVENIILIEVSQGQKSKITCSLSYVDYIPKISTVILLDMVIQEEENVHGKNREREGNFKLECVLCAHC